MPPLGQSLIVFTFVELFDSHFCFVSEDIGGAGATFVMEGFRTYFGWDCPENDVTCVPATQSEIDTDQGLVNGLFGAGAAM